MIASSSPGSLKEIVLIPHWVHEALARQKLPLSECLNFAVLQRMSSVNDLACFYGLQHYIEELVYASGTLGRCWEGTVTDRDSRALLMQTILPLAAHLQASGEIESRLFSPQSRLPWHDEPFSIHDITREVGGVVIYPGFFVGEGQPGGQPDTYREQLVTGLLKLLYAYNASHEVSGTRLFRHYLDMLSGRQLSV
ncbi:hypothetical protein P3T23_009435 [Paraburkholderia sp. GAS448]|uniref:hypothetical protein n=1 Tax=Paraburkholderia sp. GAS448 TaxID=3035136 RepID=UPI003D1A0B24